MKNRVLFVAVIMTFLVFCQKDTSPLEPKVLIPQLFLENGTYRLVPNSSDTVNSIMWQDYAIEYQYSVNDLFCYLDIAGIKWFGSHFNTGGPIETITPLKPGKKYLWKQTYHGPQGEHIHPKAVMHVISKRPGNPEKIIRAELFLENK